MLERKNSRYLFLEKGEEGKERQREINTDEREVQDSCLSCVPQPGTEQQPRPLPGTGFAPMSFWFVG